MSFGLLGVSTQAAEKLTIGYIPNNAFAPLFVIKGEGWDQQAGLDISLQRFPSMAVGMQAFAQGHVDVLYTVASVPLTASAAGINVKILYVNSMQGHHLYGRGRLAELWPHGAKAACATLLQETKRKPQFVTFFRGSMLDVVLRDWLKRQGVAQTDAEIINIPGQDEFQQAILSGSYDAVMSFEPLLSIARSKGANLTLLADTEDMVRTPVYFVVVASSKTIAGKSEALLTLGRLHRRAIDFIHAGPLRGAKHVHGYLGESLIPSSIIEQIMPKEARLYTYQADQLMDSLAAMQQMMQEQGLLRRKVPLDQLVDLRFDQKLENP